MAIETQIMEVETTDMVFFARLIVWLNNADAEKSSTVVRLRDGHAAFTEDELTRLKIELKAATRNNDLAMAQTHVIIEHDVIPGLHGTCRCDECRVVVKAMDDAHYLDRIVDRWWEKESEANNAD